MTRGDIGRWLAAGLDVGSHGLSHRRLSHLSPGDAEVELLGSARALSALIKRLSSGLPGTRAGPLLPPLKRAALVSSARPPMGAFNIDEWQP